jgi:hypothetical protein
MIYLLSSFFWPSFNFNQGTLGTLVVSCCSIVNPDSTPNTHETYALLTVDIQLLRRPKRIAYLCSVVGETHPARAWLGAQPGYDLRALDGSAVEAAGMPVSGHCWTVLVSCKCDTRSVVLTGMPLCRLTTWYHSHSSAVDWHLAEEENNTIHSSQPRMVVWLGCRIVEYLGVDVVEYTGVATSAD